MKLRDVSARTVILGELVGLGGLYLSGQVERPLLALPFLALLLSALTKWRLGNRLLLLLIGFAAVFAVTAGFFGAAENSLLITRALLAIHGLLWCAEKPDEYRYYRLGVGFVAAVLASILAPESYMLGLIFLFAVLSALSFSFGFVEKSFARRGSENLDRPVKTSLLAGLAAVATLVFLTSFLIFPILPRSKWDGRGLAETGYTELVNFQAGSLGWAGENTKPVLWIFRPEKVAWPAVLPSGLLRTKVLEGFDGTNWRAAVKQYGREVITPPRRELFRLTIYREPLASEALPVPYGAAFVENEYAPRPRYESGEFTFAGSQKKRIEYSVRVGDGFGLPRADPPRPIHRRRAPGMGRLKKLAAELGGASGDEASRIRRVVDYLRTYRASLGAVAPASGGGHPVEDFLFVTKAGHCELFATAAALLLREMDLPTRLVAGFRVAHPGETKVLTVRAADAHAWLEVYANGRWVPLDPTPHLAGRDLWPEAFTEAYDRLNAYWHRYILGYEIEPGALAAGLRTGAPWAVPAFGALLMILIGMGLRRVIRLKRQGRDPRVRAARLRELLPQESHPSRARLEARYEELRFGRKVPEAAELNAFRRELTKLRRGGAEAGEDPPAGRLAEGKRLP